MDIAKDARDGDQTVPFGDLKVFLTPEANVMLMNSTIDFSETLGFSITGTPKNSCC